VDDRARRVDALAGEGRDVAALRAALLAEAALSGGWPLMAGFAPDPLDTALALTALSDGASTAPALAAGIGLIVAQQNGDGGWPCVAGGPSEVSCAAEALGALALYSHRFFIDPAVTLGKAFLRSHLNADGSFGPPGPDQTYSSALAARALVGAGDDLGSSRLTVLGFLQGRQTSDGAWEGDTLITAVALRALDALLRVPVCGDGVINLATEACDALDLGGRSCEALGLGAGTLGCSSACTFDTTACAAPPVCGDGVRNLPGESCDGLDLGGATCQSVGFIGGTLGCNADCTFNASSCTGVPACGDGIVNRPDEQCDRGDLAGASCASLGLLGGSLTCSPSCVFNTSSCTGTGATEPSAIFFGPESAVCTSGAETRPVSIVFPPAAVVDKVDVFFLFDDTGSFAGRVPTVTGIFNSLVTDLQAALPGISLGFGVGRFEDYGGPGSSFSGEFSTGRPFILNQPIVTPDIPGFPTLISSALNRSAPGFGGDGPETTLDALFRIATGDGFDGNGNGSTVNSGPAGATTTQTAPGTSGDVPPFTSNVAPAAGTLGGVGFRPRALHLVLVAGDICSVAAYTPGEPIPGTVTGIGGATVPSSALRCSNTVGFSRFGFVSNSVSRTGNTVAGAVAPAGAATVPDTIAALNALGISVIGLADGGVSIRNPVGPSGAPSTLMSALALLTGATDAIGNPLVFNISGGTTPLRNAIVQAITTAATRPVDVSTRAVEVPADVTATLSPGVVPGVGPGGRADFSLDVTGSGVPRGAFRIEFFDARSNALLGLIPVSLECLPIVERPPDRDGDGFAEDADCDDQNAAVNPGATEIPGNGLDDDCNPATPDAMPDGEVSCTVTLDRVEYGAHEQMNVEVLLRRTGGSGSLVGLSLALHVAHSGGLPIGEAGEALAPLGEDEHRVRTFAFNTGTTDAGELVASAEILNGAATVAACSASARILASTDAGVHLVGTIQAEPSVAFFREPITLRYQVANQGNAELSPATLEILIVDAATELVRARLSDAPSLLPGATFDAAQPAPAELPVGEYIVILRGGPTNDLRTLASAALSVRVPPNVAPSCTAAEATMRGLWPPNHQFTLVGVQGVTDADDDPVTVAILGVTQDEEVLDPGGGNTCPDAILGGSSVQLRAERTGTADGRVYRIQFTASDPAGASCTGSVRVCVPHDQAGTPCVESPPVVDSTACPGSKK
ncbi:MAG: MopE-related protein, partial [Vicinamibacterales bacterium]